MFLDYSRGNFRMQKFCVSASLKHTLHLPDYDSGGWTPSNYFSSTSSQSLFSVALGPSSSEAAMLFSMSDFSRRLW